jgi:DNA-binding response OmpR family regulator
MLVFIKLHNLEQLNMVIPSQRRILLVEDYEDARDLAALTLSEYTLITARNFSEGLHLARRGYFDLYILDNWLPDRSGVELCRAIREFDPHTPILFYSAAAYERDIEYALRAGAQDYIVKPVISHELREAVSRLISAARKISFDARREEFAAIRQELAIQRMENADLREKAKEMRLRSIRLKAQIAFLGAGGTRGDFAREWLSLSLEEVRDACTPAPVSGDEHES